MASNPTLVGILFLSLISGNHAQSLIRLKTETSHYIIPFAGDRKIRADDNVYCESWRNSVETNDAGSWSTIPGRCVDYVRDYMTAGRYRSDSEVVATDALNFAKSVNVSGDGKDAWVFDIDETLLSNLPYYEDHGFGSEKFNETSFDEWVYAAEAPALPASLMLYNKVKDLGFTIILLTGRDEPERNVTEKNLIFAGYSGWERLFLRGPSDSDTTAVVYKSKIRKQVQSEGYIIQGNSGDQWSDLNGYAVAMRSFKLPNPMYYIA